MKQVLRNLCFLLFVSSGFTVIMEPTENPNYVQEDASFNEILGECLAKKEYRTIECVNRGALNSLRSLNEQDDLDFGEVHLERADGYGRELHDFDYDPSEFGNVIKATAKLIEHRSMKWDLNGLFPGLQMRVGPMLNGQGVLEFVLNEKASQFDDRQASTGRQLARHLLLPFLLGFKFSLASLIPLLFGLLILVTKKALFLTKISLAISGLLGWNSLYNAFSGHQQAPFGGVNGHLTDYDGSAGYPYPDHHITLQPYRRVQPTDFGQHVIREVLNVYENDGDSRQSLPSGKNFVWTKNV